MKDKKQLDGSSRRDILLPSANPQSGMSIDKTKANPWGTAHSPGQGEQ